MKTIFLVQGWKTAQVQVRRFDGGLTGPIPLYIYVSGSVEPFSLPVDASRADVYRWLASLEEQGFETEFSERR